MSVERPILFSAPMVRALLAGTKTQTRRKYKPRMPAPYEVVDEGPDGKPWPFYEHPETMTNYEPVPCPYGVPGDRLWVRETFFEIPDGVFYRATDPTWDEERENTRVKWKPSIFMRRRQSRLTLEVTDVRVERVQDISAADAVAEGVLHGFGEGVAANVPRALYRELWGEINGADSWAANPWVWVVSFRRAATPTDGKQGKEARE